MLALLQFDSADLAVVERMLADGRLRTLAELRGRGRWHRLESPGTILAAATYPTLYSGLEVGEHGVYYPFQWSAREQRVRPVSAFEMPEAAWERLARAGRRSLVVDPYEARLPRVPAGVVVSGWQFENRVVLGGWSDPPTARSELARRFGRVKSVVIVQGISIPFLVVLGFSPVLWTVIAAMAVRNSLMNAGNPIFTAFAMDRVSQPERATLAAAMSLMWSIGWVISGAYYSVVHASLGFDAAYTVNFVTIIVLYTLATWLYWRWFHDAERLAGKVRNAGAIFLGAYTPEAIGDYVAGSNHVLPTAGAARFRGGLGAADFMRVMSVQRVTSCRSQSPETARVARIELVAP